MTVREIVEKIEDIRQYELTLRSYKKGDLSELYANNIADALDDYAELLLDMKVKSN